MTAAAIVSGAACKFVAILSTVDDGFFKGPVGSLRVPTSIGVPPVIYRTYFAVPNIPEFASQHNYCGAKNLLSWIARRASPGPDPSSVRQAAAIRRSIAHSSISMGPFDRAASCAGSVKRRPSSLDRPARASRSILSTELRTANVFDRGRLAKFPPATPTTRADPPCRRQ